MANNSFFGLVFAIISTLFSPNSAPDPLADESDLATMRSPRTSEGASARAENSRGRVFQDCNDGCPQMVEILPGRFLMGSPRYSREQPQHAVGLYDAIAVGRFPTTFDDWDACVRDGGCVHNSAPSDEGWGRGRRPVINVSWEDAEDYVSWLSHKTRKPYRLLTEAEWEYVARAGSTTTYPWGDQIDCGKAAYGMDRNSDCDAGMSSPLGTRIVGSYPANRWGLYDMIGNVWEWCEDDWHPTYVGAPDDGSAWKGGDASMRVLRGGAWNYGASALRSADRNWYPLNGRTSYIGFRVVRPADSRSPGKKLSDLRAPRYSRSLKIVSLTTSSPESSLLAATYLT
jgi:formylglycine-generating enzyme required for sulfatase activity